MRRVGRSLLFILSFLSLQLTLISGGERCPVVSLFAHSGTAMAGMDMAGMDMAGMDMAGMDMAGMDMAGMDMAGMDMARPQGGGVQSDAPSTHQDEQSCDDDGERTSCDSMTVCVFAAVIAPVTVCNTQRAPAVPAPALAMRTPPTEGAAPDLPPPRLQS